MIWKLKESGHVKYIFTNSLSAGELCHLLYQFPLGLSDSRCFLTSGRGLEQLELPNNWIVA
jgi:hypothetical protein